MVSQFLSLSPAIRKHIYYFAGLPINIVDLPLHAGEHPNTYYNLYSLQETLALLLLCQLIHTEVKALLYSDNKFFILFRMCPSLEPLWMLSPSTIGLLTNLKIHLHVVECMSRWFCETERVHCIEPYLRKSDNPLDSASPEGQATLSKWQAIIQHLAPNIRPYTLNFSFVCDVANVETARLIVTSLAQLPPLISCHICLSHRSDPKLLQLARNAALQAIGRESPSLPSLPFRYLDLPSELRLKILEYTDLITPLNEVEWNPAEGYFLHYRD